MLHRRFKFLPADAPKPDLKIVEPRSEESSDRKQKLEDDSDTENPDAPARANWTMIWGIVVIVAISVGFWAGVWLLVKHYWK